jgi:asparagine synthase (glutamine-hydrolysing)
VVGRNTGEIEREAREQIMSVQFGRWNFEGQPPAPDYVEKVCATLAPYGPDSNESYSDGGVRIIYRAFHTTKEAHREKQPCICPSGAVITWDGRLDNRTDLISELSDSLTVNSTDVAIVTAAYEKWGTNCFAKLIGDWALSVWNPRERSVLLVKDPIGTRHLYYSFDNNQVTWSTILDPLVRFAGKTFVLNEEYIAGWFSMFPAVDLTPCIGIHSVPPSSSVLLRPGRRIVSKYWDFDPGNHIRYRTDAEYEEHFRTVFATAVQRKLRSDRPVLAELSGGMDSSSIVCMADTVIARGTAECPRLDTISWFDDSYDHLEPDMNERPYFTKVEEKRNRVGLHIDIGVLRQAEAKEEGSRKSFESEFDNDRFAATPVPNEYLSKHLKQYAAYMKLQGHRVTLSGIGGDEPNGGGVPTPTPELQDLLARARFVTLAHQLNAWAAKIRKRRLPLLWEAVHGFFSARVDLPKEMCSIPWLHPGFVRRNHPALCAYPFRVKLFGPLPSFQDHIDKLDANRRFVSHCVLNSELLREIRYPYYDRDFLEFMYAIPREQIVRVGQRRSLMKRALVGVVPNELLNRKRKAFAPPRQTTDSLTAWPSLVEIGQHIRSSSVGIVDRDRFAEALLKARHNEDVPIGSLRRTLILESWLGHLTTQGILANSMSAKSGGHFLSLEATELQASAQPKSLAS